MKYMILFSMMLAIAGFSACKKDTPTQPGSISGTISIAKDLQVNVDPQAILYVIARKEVGPPLAVKRVPQPKFPLAYNLSREDAMLPGSVFQGEVKVTVRLDKDGNAGPLQSGDMTGALANRVPIGNSDVDLTIDTLIP